MADKFKPCAECQDADACELRRECPDVDWFKIDKPTPAPADVDLKADS